MNDVRIVNEPVDIDRLSKDHWREFHDYLPTFNKEYLKNAVCIQAFDNDNAIGYLFMYVIPEPYVSGILAMVDTYYLDPKFRGKKIAKRMFLLAESVARVSGAGRICASFNMKKPHDQFFRALGFDQTHTMLSKVI